MLLYHLVTDDFPVKGATFNDLVSAHARGEVTPLRDVRPHLPRSFVRVVERATDLEVTKRFASAGRFQAALAQIHGSSVNKADAPRLRTTTLKRLGAGQGTPGRDASVASVAVLPFSDMSPAKDQECFCDGMTEELINGMTQIPGLRVAARTVRRGHSGCLRDAIEQKRARLEACRERRVGASPRPPR